MPVLISSCHRNTKLLYIARKVMEKSIYTLYSPQTHIKNIPCSMLLCFHAFIMISFMAPTYVCMWQSVQYILTHKIIQHASYHYIILLHIPHLVGTQVPSEPQPCIDQVRHASCRSPLIKNKNFYTHAFIHTLHYK